MKFLPIAAYLKAKNPNLKAVSSCQDGSKYLGNELY